MTKLTRDEIMKLQPGPNADARIAEVCGLPEIEWKVGVPCPYCGEEMYFCGKRARCTPCNEWRISPYKEYSREIADAVEALDAFAEKHGCSYIIWRRRSFGMPNHICAVEGGDLKYTDIETPGACVGIAETKEMAIVYAILLAANGA